MSDFLFKEESYRIRGACFEVYKEKGTGFLEAVYQECLELEFRTQQVPFESQPVLNLSFRGQELRQHYVPDFICYGQIIVEIKAVSELSEIHLAQLHNYLRATETRLGFLVNFGHFPKIQIERIVR